MDLKFRITEKVGLMDLKFVINQKVGLYGLKFVIGQYSDLWLKFWNQSKGRTYGPKVPYVALKLQVLRP